ncbi:hypothetical protein Y032_0004g2100 [Ancylostoma ceylanicum]|uniref:DUF7774 domain-containing protein n=1 Tax=Ancylostoma ceylanicum TaxID=53326 RepID=A0A016VUP7_9BILA|nr:hypothetical protein Y032_0004g2100 [Ancylostoma ceylanicum]
MAKKDEQKLNKYEEAIALRGLDIMRKDLLLENALTEEEKLTLRKFFETSDSKPNETMNHNILNYFYVRLSLNLGIVIVLLEYGGFFRAVSQDGY